MAGRSVRASRDTEVPVRLPVRNRDGAAFTLIELLASMAVLVVMVVLMSQMLNRTSRLWITGQANTDRSQNIRAINESIANELRTALLPLDRTSQNGFQFVVNPPAITATTFNNPTSVFWQAPCATDASRGEAAEVGYFVQWDTVVDPNDPHTNPRNPHATLCRFLVNPGTATSADANYLIYSQPTNWLSDGTLRAVAPATAAQSYRGLFAENVVGLWVRCLDSAGQPITQAFAGTAYSGNAYDSRLGYTDSTGTQSASFTSANGQPAPLCALPPVVEVSAVTLDAEAAARVTPGIKSSMDALAQRCLANPQTANGRAFVQAALQSGSGLQIIVAGLRFSETRIYLEGSR